MTPNTPWLPVAGDRVQIVYPASARTRDRRRQHGRTGTVISGGRHTALIELDDKHRICVPHANLVEIKEKLP